MTGEFRLLDKRNGHENAAVLFYHLTMLMGLCLVAHTPFTKLLQAIGREK